MQGKWCRVKASGSHVSQNSHELVWCCFPFLPSTEKKNIMWRLFLIDLHPGVNCGQKDTLCSVGSCPLPSLSAPRFWGSRIRKGRRESEKPLLWRVRLQGCSTGVLTRDPLSPSSLSSSLWRCQRWSHQKRVPCRGMSCELWAVFLTKQTFKGLIKSDFKWCNCLPTQTKISQASWSNYCCVIPRARLYLRTHTLAVTPSTFLEQMQEK